MYTIQYNNVNGITITAGATLDLSVTVYKMNDNYAFVEVMAATPILATQAYSITYADDGVYEIAISEDGGPADTYVDLNVQAYLDYIETTVKYTLCETETCEEIDYFTALQLHTLGLRFLAQNTYTPSATTDITDPLVIAELSKMHNTIKRVSDLNPNI